MQYDNQKPFQVCVLIGGKSVSILIISNLSPMRFNCEKVQRTLTSRNVETLKAYCAKFGGKMRRSVQVGSRVQKKTARRHPSSRHGAPGLSSLGRGREARGDAHQRPRGRTARGRRRAAQGHFTLRDLQMSGPLAAWPVRPHGLQNLKKVRAERAACEPLEVPGCR